MRQQDMKKQVIGFYLRLSDEDMHEFQNESNSIQSQREILRHYVQSHAEFQDTQIVEFCDDGYSGTSFSRPGIRKLLEQVKTGAVSVIIVKDFSRFGRNYIEVGNCLEQIFPFLGIRFISVNDGFDSAAADFSGEFLDAAFKNLVYDLYSKDLSEKVISVRRMKAGQGKFITPYAPYGYQKSPEQKLIPDPETAPIVRRIFHMAAEGIPKAHIAGTLNKEEIPSPLMLRRQRGDRFPCRTVNEKSIWRTCTVYSLLKDQRYAGDTVYGKSKPEAVGNRKDCAVPKEQWLIVPDTHEAIISRELFEQVNHMMKKWRSYHRDSTMPLAGVVRCAGCNRIISRVKRIRANGVRTATYRCSTQDMTKGFGCCPFTVEERQMEYVVRTMIQKAASAVVDAEFTKAAEDFTAHKAAEAEKLLIRYEREADQLSCRRLTRYEAYKEGQISREEFLMEKAASAGKLERLMSGMEKQRKNLRELRNQDTREMGSAAVFRKFTSFDTLTREMVDIFVKQICVCQDGSLRIEWKFRDFFIPILTGEYISRIEKNALNRLKEYFRD